jgi:hypothetical protein
MPDETFVPTYSAGLPLTMALFQVLGGRGAVFYVVPMLAAVAVWATYLLGTRFAGRAVGLSAALLLASSPVFLVYTMLPMSDVPVTAWWTLAFATLLLPGPRPALIAGLAASAAILTRPNLAPMAAAPGVLLLLAVVRERALDGPAGRRAAAFAAGAVPGCLAVAAIHTWLYDSPLMSPYGDLRNYYTRDNILTNLKLYPGWLLQTQTGFVLLALAAPFLAPRRLASGATTRAVAWMWLSFAIAAGASLLAYMIFDHWIYLRLVLSAFPLLLVLMAFVIVRASSVLPPALRTVAVAAIVGGLIWHGLDMARDHGAFLYREGERKAQAMGDYIARKLPENAAVISVQQSGSIRYYAGRLTVRWDFIWPARHFDSVLDTLRQLGYRPYIVLEAWEVPLFKEKFADVSRLGALDWPPAAWLNHDTRVYLYDPADRDTAVSGRIVRPEIIY